MNRIKIAVAAMAVLAAAVTVKAGEAVTFESLYKAPVSDSGIEVPVPQAVKAAARPFDAYPGCDSVNNMFMMQPTMEDALSMLRPCSQSLKAAFGVPVIFAKASFNGSEIIEVSVGDSQAALDTIRRGVISQAGQFFGYSVKIKSLRGAAVVKSEFYSRIDCEIRVAGRRNTVSFGVAGLGGPGAELLSLNQNDEDAPIIEGEDNRDIKSMNAQGGDMREDDRTLTLVGDNDGSSFIKLVLFRDSDYKRGWASETGSESPNWYTSDVSCRVSAL